MNKPFTPKQTCRFFVLFYALFSAFFIYSYMVNEPISGLFLLMLSPIQIIKSICYVSYCYLVHIQSLLLVHLQILHLTQSRFLPLPHYRLLQQSLPL